MFGPGPTFRNEAWMVLGMPIARRDDRAAALERRANPMIEWGDHFIAASDGKGSARAEIILHVDNQQGIGLLHRYWRGSHLEPIPFMLLKILFQIVLGLKACNHIFRNVIDLGSRAY